MKSRLIGTLAASLVALLALSGCSSSSNTEETRIRLDFAYWNPLSLVIKDQGWLEAELADEGIEVEWIQSLGSSTALENLNAEAIDIGSSAGSAVFAARANGALINTVGVFSQPNWGTIVVPANSPIRSVADLAGKTIAAASGTDPYFFLLQALARDGLSSADVEIVNLIHADGQKALENGDVDAWAGLDPLTATSQRTTGSVILVNEPSFNTWGVLNTTEKFLKAKPELVELVLVQYERARAWILANPEAAVDILARDAGLNLEDATRVLNERTNIAVSLIPGETQLAVFRTILPVLVAEDKVKSQEAAELALLELIEDSIARKVAG